MLSSVPVERSRIFHLIPLVTLQAFGLVCGLAGVRWSSAIIPPEILGTFGLLIGTHTLASMVTHLGLIQHLQRHWQPEATNRAYLQQLLKHARAPTLILAVGLIFIWAILHAADKTIAPAWWGWMFAVNLLAAAAQLIHAVLQTEQRYWAHCVVSMLGSATRSFLPLLLVSVGGSSIGLLGLGFFGHTLIWVVAGWLYLRTTRYHGADGGSAAADSPERMVGTFMLVGVLVWAGSIAHRFLAPHLLTPIATGYFMLAANLTAIVPSAIGLIGQSYTFPVLYAAARQGASSGELWRITWRNLTVIMVLGQLGLLALAWLGPHLIGIVLDARYQLSLGWLLATGAAALSAVSGGFVCNWFIAQNQERGCLELMAWSVGFRLVCQFALTLTGNEDWFRLGLILLPWPTLLLEYGVARRAWRRASERG